MEIVTFVLGGAIGWWLRSRHEPPPLPSATELVHRASQGEEGVLAFIELVEQKAQAGDEEAMGMLADITAALESAQRRGGQLAGQGRTRQMQQMPDGSTQMVIA